MTDGWWPEIRAGFNGVAYSPAGAIFAVDGTAYAGAPSPPQPLTNDGTGWWSGFSSGIVGGLINVQDGLWASTCIGYPAVTYPMWPSVQAGRAALNAALQNYAAVYRAAHGTLEGLALLLTGYSQGAMVVGQTLWLDIMAPDGVLHYLAPYVYRAYLFGDPFRCPGVAHGNELAGLALPPAVDGAVTGGIAGPLDYTVEQANMLAPDGRYLVNSFVNPGDLYADCPVGTNPWSGEFSTGHVETGIFNIVMNATFVDVVAIAEDLLVPVATVEAIVNAGFFFAQGMNAPHYQYYNSMDAAISDALALGNSLPHAGC